MKPLANAWASRARAIGRPTPRLAKGLRAIESPCPCSTRAAARDFRAIAVCKQAIHSWLIPLSMLVRAIGEGLIAPFDARSSAQQVDNPPCNARSSAQQLDNPLSMLVRAIGEGLILQAPLAGAMGERPSDLLSASSLATLGCLVHPVDGLRDCANRVGTGLLRIASTIAASDCNPGAKPCMIATKAAERDGRKWI